MLDRLALERMVPTRPSPSAVARTGVLAAAAILAATAAAAILESPTFELADASPVYFVAVAVVGALIGTWSAVATAVLSFVMYDLLFTQPRFTLLVEDPREWLDLLLFLVLAVIVGRLAALGTERAAEASRRAAEATGLFAVGRILATAPDVETAAPQVAERLVASAGLQRVWIVAERGGPSVLADTAPGDPLPTSAFETHLVRKPGDSPAVWQRSHVAATAPAGSGRAGSERARATANAPLLRVRMEADGVAVGSIKALARPGTTEPDRSETRLLALAADQLGLAIRRDALRREATEVEIARQADALKTALLDAVSHDLRTPLASIRAEAGMLADRDIPLGDEQARRAGAAIDAEAERLDRLVREVLDLSRVESGTLRPDLEAIDVGDALRSVVDRLRPLLGAREIVVDVADHVAPIRADAVLLDGLLANLIENVAWHTAPPAALRVGAVRDGRRIAITIEDAGPGVPPEALAGLFERFHRLPQAREGSRRGLGIGLSIVRGFAEAMGATVRAEPSPLGGLRIVVTVPAVGEPVSEPVA